MSARMQFCWRFPGLRAVSGIWSGAAADSLSLGSKRSGRVRLQKTQPKRRRFETVCRSLQRDADRSLLRSIAPGWTGLCGRKVCSRAWCPAIARWADARHFGCFPLCRLALSRRYSIDLLFGSQYLSPAGAVTPVGRSAKPYAVQDHLKTTVFMPVSYTHLTLPTN